MKEYRFSSIFVLIILSTLFFPAISIASPVESPYLKIHYRESDVDNEILEQNMNNFTGAYIWNNAVWFAYHGSKPYFYGYLTEGQEQILIQAFTTNITTVLEYIKNNEFNMDYNDIYPYDPLDHDLDWYDNIIQIDENWYLASYNLNFTPYPLIDSVAILFIILTAFAFAGLGFLIWKYKKTKSKLSLAGLIILLIIGIFLLIMAILWIYSNTQVCS